MSERACPCLPKGRKDGVSLYTCPTRRSDRLDGVPIDEMAGGLVGGVGRGSDEVRDVLGEGQGDGNHRFPAHLETPVLVISTSANSQREQVVDSLNILLKILPYNADVDIIVPTSSQTATLE